MNYDAYAAFEEGDDNKTKSNEEMMNAFIFVKFVIL